MRTFSREFAAGEKVEWMIPGAELRLILAVSSVDIELIRGGIVLDERSVGVGTGAWTKPLGGFEGFRITSSAAQTVNFAVSSGESGYDVAFGSVTLENPSLVIGNTSGNPVPVYAPAALAVSGPLTDTQLRATPVPISGTISGPLTDTQLRATAVPVSGPLTDAQLRATAVPVSGPLTDAQLRATAVPVSGPLTDAQLRATAVPVSLAKPHADTWRNLDDMTTWFSSTALSANSGEEIFSAASNANGAIVWEAELMNGATSGTPVTVLVAKATSPTSITDGKLVLVQVIQPVQRDQPIYIPAGLGLYRICNAAQNFAANCVRYDLL